MGISASRRADDEIQSTDADVEGMRAAGRLAARVLDMAEKMIVGGVTTTNDIDVAVHEMTIEHGAYPSPLDTEGSRRACARV